MWRNLLTSQMTIDPMKTSKVRWRCRIHLESLSNFVNTWKANTVPTGYLSVVLFSAG
ncbi:unnamed protein product [Haemonchus placei]|uniref:Ovule protein n=1 Tax=Haemonchus placei TaxID=6290 RepID=A0A0N4WLU5_HAEPC|nr:unnamed protein product [Haemonchus placei]